MSSTALTVAPAVPVDTHEVMNTVIHHALRRDLRRFAEILRRPISFRRRDLLLGHLRYVLAQLHHHHTVEDEFIWPAVLTLDPHLQPLFEQMESEHGRLSWVIDRLERTSRAWSACGDAEHRSAVRLAVIDLETVLEPHLVHEEADGMPAVARTLTAQDWAPIEKHLRGKGSPAAMARQLFWLLDDLDERRLAIVMRVLPRPLFAALRVVFGRREAKRARLLWG